jgi:hypothetical protein
MKSMKKQMRIAAAVLTGALLILTGPLGAFAAADNAVEFDLADGETPEWDYVGVTTRGSLNDLFGEVTKELAPGATRTVDVQLRNRSDESVTFYLRAEALTGDGAKALESDFAGKTAIDDLLGYIETEVYYGDGRIYKGTLGGAAADNTIYARDGALLGTLSANSYGSIKVTLSVSEKLDNRYFNALCAVNWTFTATGGATDGPPPPPPPPPRLDDGQLTEIEDDDTPLATQLGEPGEPEVVVIADPETPLALPQTGGLMTYATPAALALAVLLALYAATYVRGRKKENKAS